MENLKIKVKNESESKEVQDLLFELGGDFCFGGKLHCNTHLGLVTINKNGLMANIELQGFDYKEITINQLRDMVVLKRNSIDDTTHTGRSGSQYYIGVESYFWDGIKLEQRDFLNLGYLKPIEKDGGMKEFLNPEQEYALVKCFVGETPIHESWIEVPEGAEIFLLDKSCGENVLYFVKHDGEVFHEYYISGTDISHNSWIKGTIKELHDGMGKVLWERNLTKTNTVIQDELKSINKDVEVKKKEFLNPEQYYALVECFVGETRIPSSWIEVPEGAEEYRANYKFYKNNCELFYSSLLFEWAKSSMPEYITLWKRNPETSNTSTQEKLKFIEKWLNGEKIQYILGVESEKIQWHNFTEGAMQYIKRPDIKFREAPKYVTIDGIEFKSVEKLLKYVKNNFDLEGEE